MGELIRLDRAALHRDLKRFGHPDVQEYWSLRKPPLCIRRLVAALDTSTASCKLNTLSLTHTVSSVAVFDG